MLPKHMRLDPRQALKTKTTTKPFYSVHLKLWVLRNIGQNTSRWQIKIFKKTLKKSTDRNQIKRIIRNIVMSLQPKINRDGDFVIQLTKPVTKKDSSLLNTEIIQLLQKIGVYEKPNS